RQLPAPRGRSAGPDAFRFVNGRPLGYRRVTIIEPFAHDSPMLIACPNCATSYEVEPSSLGRAGRPVRCVRCRHVWFATAPAVVAAAVAEPVAAEPAAAAPAVGSGAPPPEVPTAAPESPPEPTVAAEPDPEPVTAATDPSPAGAEAEAPAP